MPHDHHERFRNDPEYRANYMKHHEIAERAPRPTYHGAPYNGPHGAHLGHMPGHGGAAKAHKPSVGGGIKHHSAASAGHPIRTAPPLVLHTTHANIQRAQAFAPHVKARVFHHDLATQHAIDRVSGRGALIGGGVGAVAGGAAAAAAGGLGVGHGAFAGGSLGMTVGRGIGHMIGQRRATRADRAMEAHHGMTAHDHALVAVHNAKVMTDPMYRAAHAADHAAILGHRPGIDTATPHPRGPAVRDAGRSGGSGGGLHRDNHGRFA